MVDLQTAITAISLAGAGGQAIVTMRWYEPPEIDGREPNPIFEAGLFFVAFAVIFALMGYALSAVAGLAPPYTSVGLLVLVPVGLYLAYTTYMAVQIGEGTEDEGQGKSNNKGKGELDQATTLMQFVLGLVISVYPIVILLV